MRSLLVTVGAILLGAAAYFALIPANAGGFNCGAPLHATTDPAAAAASLCVQAVADHRQLAMYLAIGGVVAIVIGVFVGRSSD